MRTAGGVPAFSRAKRRASAPFSNFRFFFLRTTTNVLGHSEAAQGKFDVGRLAEAASPRHVADADCHRSDRRALGIRVGLHATKFQASSQRNSVHIRTREYRGLARPGTGFQFSFARADRSNGVDDARLSIIACWDLPIPWDIHVPIVRGDCASEYLFYRAHMRTNLLRR